MSNMTTQGSKSLATNSQPSDQILKSDVVIPYLLLVQDLSDLNKSRKAQPGDICKSTTTVKYADEKTMAEIIFLHKPKETWINEEKPPGGQRFKYKSVEPRTAANENLPWYYRLDAKGFQVECPPGEATHRRVKQLSVFAILRADIEAFQAEMKKAEAGELPDPSKALSPVLVSFRSMSYDAGKTVSNFFKEASLFKIPIWKYTVKIGCELRRDEDTSYHVYKVDTNKPTPLPQELFDIVLDWATLVTSSDVQVHTEAEEGMEETGPKTVSQTPPVAAGKVKNYAPGANDAAHSR